jgi:ABC-type Zn uptake system ZnuABC Zn-binding protein ZnuA
MLTIKRYAAIFLSFVLAAGVFVRPAVAETRLQVVTTTSDLKSITQWIGGDRVEVFSFSSGTENPHFVSPKPSYMVKARGADLLIRNGFELESGWEPLIIEGARNTKIQVGHIGHLDVSRGITPLEIPVQTMDRSMGDIHAHGNPHYWLDPFNAKIVASTVAQRLSEISPGDASYFQDNLAAFQKKIDEKMIEWTKALAPYKGEKIITYHKSWPYFAERFGFVIVDQLEPKPGIPPSPTHLKDVVDLVKKERVKVILNENFYKEDAADYVAQKTGAAVVSAPVSVGGVQEVQDYFALIDTIVQRLQKGFEP